VAAPVVAQDWDSCLQCPSRHTFPLSNTRKNQKKFT
jgi:hypothetical protein